MGVLTWLPLLAAVTVICGEPAIAIDPVTVHVASEFGDHPATKQVTLRTSQHAAAHNLPALAPGKQCFDKKQLEYSKTTGIVHIATANVSTCAKATGLHALVLIYDDDTKKFMLADGKTTFAVDDDAALDKHLDKLVTAILRNQPTKMDGSDVAVPVWLIITVGTLFGVLMAGNCIFFNMARKARMRDEIAETKKKSSSKSSSSHKASGSSKRGGSNSGQKKKKASGSSRSSRSSRSAKSSSGKKKKSRSSSSSKGVQKASVSSCRSSKSLSTRTCDAGAPTSVKVVAVAAPPLHKMLPSEKDEVATVMASRAGLPERTLERRVEMPMTEDEFILAMKKVIEFVIEFYRNPSKYPVSSAIRPNDIFNQLPQRAPENPERFENVWHDFNEIILKGCLHWQHPQFHAFFPCGRSYPDILAETVISSLGTVGFTWSANPAITELDTAMVNWVGRALGIPEPFLFRGLDTAASEGGGYIADTASDAIFCAVMAARHTKIEQELDKQGRPKEKNTESEKHTAQEYAARAAIMSKMVAYGSYESHSSFEKACKMACVRCRPIKIYEEDDWGMRRVHVEKEMEKDLQRGLIPFYLHVALGTTSTATSDYLAELTPLREKFNVWVHVDAAYAGSAWVVEKYRKNAGLEKVDSININLHKFFLTSTSCTMFWTRRQRDYKEGFSVTPAYLKTRRGANDLRDWGVQLSRRFKSLKVYMLLRVYGVNGMRAYVTRLIEMTDYMEQKILRLPNIRKFGKTNYALFSVQYSEPGWSTEQVNVATTRLCEHINNSYKIVLTHSKVGYDNHFHDIIRFAITFERSSKADIDHSVAIVTQLLADFRKKMAEDPSFLDASKSSSSVRNLHEDDLGIVGSPNPTLSKTPTNVKSAISGESLASPARSLSQLSALTSVTQESTKLSAVTSPQPVTNISAIKTVQLSAVAAPPAAPAASKMPPLPPPSFEDPSSKSGGAAAPPAPATPPPPAPPTDQQPSYSAAEVTARSDVTTEKK